MKDINAIDANGNSALHMASANGHAGWLTTASPSFFQFNPTLSPLAHAHTHMYYIIRAYILTYVDAQFNISYKHISKVTTQENQ